MRGFKHRLELNNKQVTMAYQHCGVARHAWNWGLALCNEISDKRGKLPSAIDLHKLLVSDVKPNNLWYYNSSKCPPHQALRNLAMSWSRFFADHKKGVVAKKKSAYIKEMKAKGLPLNKKKLATMCRPSFKKKGVRGSFYLEGNIVVEGNKIKIPIFGWVKMSESYDKSFRVKNVVISKQSDHFFISFKREIQPDQFKVLGIEDKDIVGVDIGIKTLATMSDGSIVANPKAFKRFKRKLKTSQRQVSKKYKKDTKVQSKNYYKAQKAVSRIHYKITCIRKGTIHKLTTNLAKSHSLIGIEDLNLSGMMKNHKLANAIQDGGFYEFRRQLEYKTKWYGSKLVIIDRFYPSSKTCSDCGNVKKELKLSDRIYCCEACGMCIDRDLNASKNIEGKALSYSVSACGGSEKPTYTSVGGPMKQEENIMVV